MKQLKFKCTLLSDIILNQKAETEGPNKTLDFIPGACFLGIAANEYDKLDRENAWLLFHSGKVRFGDAHPSHNGARTNKVPSMYFHPKYKSADNNYFIHCALTEERLQNLKPLQLKQCREGFYDFTDKVAVKVDVPTNIAIKSAHDRINRRSEDKMMYSYQSIAKGTEFLFTVEVDDEALAETVKNALCGRRRLGRSRTAQYGLVDIQPHEFKEPTSNPSKDIVTVYADSRLIFFDKYGQPTFRPTPHDLGIPDQAAEIVWEKSQIRTFQYSPWNFKRNSFDCDRCGIEKGSVFVVKTTTSPDVSQYIGSYRNEGFGHVLYNPSFLEADSDGTALYTLSNDIETEKSTARPTTHTTDTPLLKYLEQKSQQATDTLSIYQTVNNWVNSNKKYFVGKEKFASQWGAIRGLAMSTKDDSKIKDIVIEYLTHGVKSEDWEGTRINNLIQFMNKECTNADIRMKLVNLSAEMAKICK